MQRPEPRRTGRRNAPAYGPQPYGPQPYGPRSNDPQPPRPNSYGPNPPEPNPYGSGWYEPPPDPYGTQPGYGTPRLRHAHGQNQAAPAGRPGRSASDRARTAVVSASAAEIRGFFRLHGQVILALIAVFLCWSGFSVGQALAAPGSRSTAAKLAR